MAVNQQIASCKIKLPTLEPSRDPILRIIIENFASQVLQTVTIFKMKD